MRLPRPPATKDQRQWEIWFDAVYRLLAGITGIVWSAIDFSGSKLTDLATRNHSDLQNIEGTGTQHISDADRTNWDGKGDMTKAVYDPANIAQQLVGTTATQTLTHKTINDYLNSYIDADALHTKVFNNSGGALSIGTPVYNTQWNAPNSAPEVIKARANSSSTCPCHGLIEESSVADNAVGSIRTAGILNNVNTSLWSDGTDLWLSPTTAGVLTSTEPNTVGQYKQFIGTVVRQHATQGVILVQIGPALLITAGGSVTATQVSCALGSTPVYSKKFTITDAAVSPTSKLITSLVRESDEVEFSGVQCVAHTPSAGSFDLTIFSTDGPTSGTFTVNYVVG